MPVMNMLLKPTKTRVAKIPWDHAEQKIKKPKKHRMCFQNAQIECNRYRRYCKKLHNTYCLLPEWTTASSSHIQCTQAFIILEEII